MIDNVVILPEAVDDLAESLAWYEGRIPVQQCLSGFPPARTVRSTFRNTSAVAFNSIVRIVIAP